MGDVPRSPGLRLIGHAAGWGWFWLVLGAVAVVLLITLYRAERRLVSARLGGLLLTLRLIVAVLFIAALFEPVLLLTRRDRVRGRIVLGIDASESMGLVDPGTVPRQRSAVARELLSHPAMMGLRARVDLDPRAFASGSWPTTLDGTGPSPPENQDLDTTDWTSVLEQALTDRETGPVQGVVLLTDGQFNGPRPEAVDAILSRLKERGAPVFPVLIGSSVPPRDLAVASVQAPRYVAKGQAANIVVTVKVDGIEAGSEVPVVLEMPGIETQRRTVLVENGPGRPVVSFRVLVPNVGHHQGRVRVGPVENDARPDNDVATYTVNVTDTRSRVLLLAGEAAWEFRYLRAALQRDPRVTLESVVFRQPTSPGTPGPAYPNTIPSTGHGPTWDLILICDLTSADLDGPAWEWLEHYVGEEGGTLALGAGPMGWPGLAAVPTIARLLPVSAVARVPDEAVAADPERPSLPPGIRLHPDPAALEGPWPMLQLADDAKLSTRAWSSLPRLPWALQGAPKPTATVLATTGTPGAAILAAMPYGAGKVLWVGTDATWRWRYRLGDAAHHRFWGQVVSWSAQGTLAGGNRLVQFGPVAPHAQAGAPIAVRARFREDVPPGTTVVARAIPLQGGGPPVLVPLRARRDQPSTFEAEAPGLHAGTYVMRLDAPELSTAIAGAGPMRDAPLEVSRRTTSERVELAARRDTLEHLAQATGGRVFTPGDISQLPSALPITPITRDHVEFARLADRPESFALLVVVLALEWALRKRAGLL